MKISRHCLDDKDRLMLYNRNIRSGSKEYLKMERFFKQPAEHYAKGKDGGAMYNGNFTYPRISIKETGARMRRICKAKGITVADIQKALFLASNQAVYDWFNGRNLPALNNLYALARLLDVPMEALIVEEGMETENAPNVSESAQDNLKKRVLIYTDEIQKRCA